METAPIFNEVFWVGIDTEFRYNMMTQLCEFLERDPVSEQAFNRYVTEWKKVNRVPKTNKIRQQYSSTHFQLTELWQKLFQYQFATDCHSRAVPNPAIC